MLTIVENVTKLLQMVHYHRKKNNGTGAKAQIHDVESCMDK